MTVQEGKEMINELKASGWTEEEIVSGFYQLYVDDEINENELGDLVGLVGYELSEEFLAMSPEDKKTKGWAEEEVSEDVKEGEETTGEDTASEEDKEEPKEEPKEDKEESEEEQRAKAKKLFGLD